MKKVFTISCFFALTVACFAQKKATKLDEPGNTVNFKTASIKSSANSQNTEKEGLTLIEADFDFGKIPQGKPVTHTFQFKNTGDLPLALDNVVASCGCTTPIWNKDTIPVGGTGIIKVGYNAASEGPFNKIVTITYNGTQNKPIIIKGEVWKTPATSAPLNTALNSFKNEQ